MSTRHFTPRLFSFLRDLAANNDREWFAAQRDRYEADVREPVRAFIRDVAPMLEELAPHLIVDDSKSGGSLMRINRDLRFNPDAPPYKTYVGIHFRHLDFKARSTPSIFLRFEPRHSAVGIGLWRPDAPAAAAVRVAIAEHPDEWRQVVGDPAFSGTFDLVGDSLKRPPKGFDPDHPLIETLQRKDFAAAASLSQTRITAPGFLSDFVSTCREAGPFLEFLAGAVGVKL
ncbi:MAG TPA: TIGR02453 family protein [Acidimicrobiia bacterium]|nr:TIGR02453 family protein [Acidimicrobiia bacterium]